ncbi:MAG: TetR/AcrR family transcriptional regulator [Eubacterium sp.]|nr:TetR/AcrR family transcriptional regulator [Eubacterium sp.]
MPYDFDKTHEKILESAMNNFSQVGFRDASIRNICKDAGVTNGAFYAHFKSKDELFSALVEGCLNQFNDLYNGFTDIKIQSAEDVINMFKMSYTSVETLIHYVYENKAIFMLILKNSGGSSYENYVNDLIEEESKNTMIFMESCRAYMKKPENISERIARIGSALVINSMFEAFVAGESEEDNIKDTRLSSDYCIAGYREILGL